MSLFVKVKKEKLSLVHDDFLYYTHTSISKVDMAMQPLPLPWLTKSYPEIVDRHNISWVQCSTPL